jgi:hypothetical protein
MALQLALSLFATAPKRRRDEIIKTTRCTAYSRQHRNRGEAAALLAIFEKWEADRVRR